MAGTCGIGLELIIVIVSIPEDVYYNFLCNSALIVSDGSLSTG